MIEKSLGNMDFHTALEALDIPLHIISADETLIYANPAWEQYIGIPRAQMLGNHINHALGKINLEFYFSIETDGDNAAHTVTHFDQKVYGSVALSALHQKKRLSMFTYSNTKNKVMVSSTPIFKDGQVQFVLTTCTDLTTSLSLRDQLEDAIQHNAIISKELELYGYTGRISQGFVLSPQLDSHSHSAPA